MRTEADTRYTLHSPNEAQGVVTSVAAFNFRGISVVVESPHADLLQRLRGDFSEFTADSQKSPRLHVKAFLEVLPLRLRQTIQLQSGKKTRNCIIYGRGTLRINDYFGRSYAEYDFKKNTANVYGLSSDALHETVYLIIQSRVGKLLDQEGLHRLHAMGVEIDNHCILLTLPMGGGKTTFFLELLKDPAARILSDDCPLITTRGTAWAFPIRVGTTPEGRARLGAHPSLNWDKCYELCRMRYGRKLLLPISAIQNRVLEKEAARVTLLIGRRTGKPGCKVKSVTFLTVLPVILLNLGVGVGLPMMREYYVEGRWGDLASLLKILRSRLRATLSLAWKARCLRIELGTDSPTNVRVLRAYLAGS